MARVKSPITGNQKCRIESSVKNLWLVQSISLSRLLAALLFASLAFQNVPLQLLICIYGFAMCSDLADGFLARKLDRESYMGKIIDLISDKSLTVVSLLYAAKRDIYLLPLALIATREIVVIGLRAIIIDGSQLLPTSRLFGGMMALLLWGNTLFLVLVPKDNDLVQIAGHIYWLCALVFVTNLTWRIYVSRRRIMASLTKAG